MLAVAGYVGALAVPRTAPASTVVEPFGQVLGGAWRALRGDRALWLAALGSVAFWGLASLLGQDVLVYGKQVLGFEDKYKGLPYALFAIGVGAGAALAGKLSRGVVGPGWSGTGAWTSYARLDPAAPRDQAFRRP